MSLNNTANGSELAAAQTRIAELEAENLLLRRKLRQADLTIREVDVVITGRDQAVPTELTQERPRAPSGGGRFQGPYTGRFINQWDESNVPTFPLRPAFETAPNYPSTDLVTFDGCANDPYHPSSMPIYQTATFVQPNINEYGPYDYTRSGNPTRTALETITAKLDAAYAAFAFSTGMAALANLVSLLDSGSEILASDDLYGGMHRLLTLVATRQGISVRFVNTTDLESLRKEVRPGVTKLIHIESPSNPLMRITDIRGVAEIAHGCGALLSADCTMMTPVRCQPLTMGCDVVIHSATKFFSGHSDVMGGMLCVKDPELAKRAAFLQNAMGTALAPFDCWLMLRGLKTLALRVERAEVNALAVARFLCRQHPFVTRVHYAGLNPDKLNGALTKGDSDTDLSMSPTSINVLSITPEAYALHHAQCTGPGTVISFQTGCVKKSQRFVDSCKLFKLTVSFGSCNSLVEMPCALSHASIPKEKRTLPEDLLRLSIGIEHITDLLRDLAQAIEAASKVDEATNEATSSTPSKKQ